MSEANGTEPLERGRYAIFPHPSDRGILIVRATGTCERCQNCGCGDQQEVIDLSASGMPGMLKRMRALGGLVKL